MSEGGYYTYKDQYRPDCFRVVAPWGEIVATCETREQARAELLRRVQGSRLCPTCGGVGEHKIGCDALDVPQ